MKKHIIQSVKNEVDDVFEVGEEVKHQGAKDEVAVIESFEQLNSVEIRAHTTRGYCDISFLVKVEAS